MGFCLLANIPIAIEAARARHGVKRIAVLDWDVHHGNGTQSIFYERDDVLTVSLHQEGCFPVGYSGAPDRGQGRGLGYNVNVPLLPGGGHDAYLYAMERIVTPAIDRYRPELIIVASGFDANGVDPLARMLLHSESYRRLSELVMALADRPLRRQARGGARGRLLGGVRSVLRPRGGGNAGRRAPGRRRPVPPLHRWPAAQ